MGRDSRKIWHWRDKPHLTETPRVCKEPQLILDNTVHPQKLFRTATWHAPNGQVHNQMDFILTPQQRFKSSLNKANTRSFLGANAGSDHDLFFATIKLKLKTKHFMKGPTPSIRFDLA